MNCHYCGIFLDFNYIFTHREELVVCKSCYKYHKNDQEYCDCESCAQLIEKWNSQFVEVKEWED